MSEFVQYYSKGQVGKTWLSSKQCTAVYMFYSICTSQTLCYVFKIRLLLDKVGLHQLREHLNMAWLKLRFKF